MLTKNLLKYSVRKQKVYPKFIDEKDAKTSKLAKDLIQAYIKSRGVTINELNKKVQKLKSGVNPLFDGLNKLLLNRLDSSSEKDVETIATERHALIIESQKLRQEKIFENIEEFYETLESRVGKGKKELQDE